MSDTKPHTEQDFEYLEGRVAGMEYCCAYAFGIILANLPIERREAWTLEALIPLEERLSRLTPIRQRGAMGAAERIMTTALESANASGRKPPGS